MRPGYVKLYRKILEWGWYGDPIVRDIFHFLLVTASFKDTNWMGYDLKKGQCIITYDKISEILGHSTQEVRTALKKLKSTGEITSQPTRKGNLVTIVNWEDYQGSDEEKTDQSTGEITSKQHDSNMIATSYQQHYKKLKNVKKDKNVKNIIEGDKPPSKHKHGEYKNVLFTEDEFEKLKQEFPDYQNRIERLSEYIASTGKSYKSHLATIRAWAKKDVERPQKTQQPSKNNFTRYSIPDSGGEDEELLMAMRQKQLQGDKG